MTTTMQPTTSDLDLYLKLLDNAHLKYGLAHQPDAEINNNKLEEYADYAIKRTFGGTDLLFSEYRKEQVWKP